MEAFVETGLSVEIIEAIKDLGFEKPTPIQERVIPHLLASQQDLVASAQTGTGKTAAFGLPAIQLTDIDNKTPQTLVLCPTRELCVQIARDLNDFSKYCMGLRVVAVYGGASIHTQIGSLKRGAHIVVGTPGRALDLIQRNKLVLNKVRRVVLDEADEMLTMGFKDDLEAILAAVPEDRQTLLFSATMSGGLVRIRKQYMQDPVEIAVASQNQAAENVEHIFYMVHAKDRYEMLKRIADMNPDIYGIVFCRTRRDTKEVAAKLMNDGYNADALHGELSQAQRDEVMRKLRKRKIQLLVATDVAARGLDVDDLTHVINYNLPDQDEVYVHRSGRTGRAGKSGISIAIVHTREGRRIRDIERNARIRFTRERVPTGQEICAKQLIALIDKVEQTTVDQEQIAPFLPAIYDKLQHLSREELIQHFVSAEFNRFLAYYKGARDIGAGDKRKEATPRHPEGNRKQRRTGGFTRFFINVGSKQNLTPKHLIGLINHSLDSSDAAIGRIEIMKKFSFFEIDSRRAEELQKAIHGRHYADIPVVIEPASDRPEVMPREKKKFKHKPGGKKGKNFKDRKKGKGSAGRRGRKN